MSIAIWNEICFSLSQYTKAKLALMCKVINKCATSSLYHNIVIAINLRVPVRFVGLGAKTWLRHLAESLKVSWITAEEKLNQLLVSLEEKPTIFEYINHITLYNPLKEKMNVLYDLCSERLSIVSHIDPLYDMFGVENGRCFCSYGVFKTIERLKAYRSTEYLLYEVKTMLIPEIIVKVYAYTRIDSLSFINIYRNPDDLSVLRELSSRTKHVLFDIIDNMCPELQTKSIHKLASSIDITHIKIFSLCIRDTTFERYILLCSEAGEFVRQKLGLPNVTEFRLRMKPTGDMLSFTLIRDLVHSFIGIESLCLSFKPAQELNVGENFLCELVQMISQIPKIGHFDFERLPSTTWAFLMSESERSIFGCTCDDCDYIRRHSKFYRDWSAESLFAKFQRLSNSRQLYTRLLGYPGHIFLCKEIDEHKDEPHNNSLHNKLRGPIFRMGNRPTSRLLETYVVHQFRPLVKVLGEKIPTLKTLWLDGIAYELIDGRFELIYDHDDFEFSLVPEYERFWMPSKQVFNSKPTQES